MQTLFGLVTQYSSLRDGPKERLRRRLDPDHPKRNAPLVSFAAVFWDVTPFVFCCYVMGLFNRPQGNHKHNRKECCSDVSRPLETMVDPTCQTTYGLFGNDCVNTWPLNIPPRSVS